MRIKKCATCGKEIDLDKKRERYSSVRLEFFQRRNGSAAMRRIYFCSDTCFYQAMREKIK